MSLSEERLREIEARANAAEPGPWEHVGRLDGFMEGRIEDATGDVVVYDEGSPDGLTAEFIAHARTDVPELIAEIRRLRALVAEEDIEALEDYGQEYGPLLEIAARLRQIPPTTESHE